MGLLLLSIGKLDEAESYFWEALKTRRRLLGVDHPDTLASITGIGWLLETTGKLDEGLVCGA